MKTKNLIATLLFSTTLLISASYTPSFAASGNAAAHQALIKLPGQDTKDTYLLNRLTLRGSTTPIGRPGFYATNAVNTVTGRSVYGTIAAKVTVPVNSRIINVAFAGFGSQQEDDPVPFTSAQQFLNNFVYSAEFSRTLSEYQTNPVQGAISIPLNLTSADITQIGTTRSTLNITYPVFKFSKNFTSSTTIAAGTYYMRIVGTSTNTNAVFRLSTVGTNDKLNPDFYISSNTPFGNAPSSAAYQLVTKPVVAPQ